VIDYAGPSSGHEPIRLAPRAATVAWVVLLAGGACLGGAAALGALWGWDRFYHAYLTAWAYFLSLGLGGLFFVLLQHLTHAGWSVNIRRVGEWLMATLPLMAMLAIPILLAVWMQKGELYPWAQRHDAPGAPHLSPGKQAYLSPAFFTARLVVYLAIWSALGWWYWRNSTRQDASGDPALTSRMQAFSAPAMVVLAVTLTLAALDLLMSLDPTWYSTIFGVYYFAGSAAGVFAAIVVLLFVLQRLGYLGQSVTTEHYHDLGKFLFGFVFFWGYIAFSQYMLIWYANIPEETAWLVRRGASTAAQDPKDWSAVCVLLLLGHLLIPFLGLISRHVKRTPPLLAFWAAWVLVFHGLDMHWLVAPELDGRFHLGPVEGLAFLGMGGVFLGTVIGLASRHAIRPLRDPRIEESLAFENV
jgi:nicotinamide riboside transporter PnuC